MSTSIRQGWTLEVQDFRGLAHATWSPVGVSVLVGPNGSGKTTLLDALALLRNIYLRGIGPALAHAGGPAGQKRVGADPADPVVLKFSVGELAWQVQLYVQGGSVDQQIGELVTCGEDVLLRREMFASAFFVGSERHEIDTERCSLRQYVDQLPMPNALQPLVDMLRDLRVYCHYAFEQLGSPPLSDQASRYLHPSGRNLAYVLQSWLSAQRRYGDQFKWIVDTARRAFPRFDGLDILQVGQSVDLRFFLTDMGADDGLPFHLAADGLRVGLLHLTAIAGAKPGSIVALDEVENYLHPHAIRVICEAAIERADEYDLTVLLTSHSPVVLNVFKDEPDQVYFTALDGRGPRTLEHEFDPEWLAHFNPGDLYERLQFGGPTDEQTPHRG